MVKIYDDYDNPRLASNKDPATVNITRFLPEVYQCSVLITTHSSHVEMGHLIQVRKVEEISAGDDYRYAAGSRAGSRIDSSDNRCGHL